MKKLLPMLLALAVFTAALPVTFAQEKTERTDRKSKTAKKKGRKKKNDETKK